MSRVRQGSVGTSAPIVFQATLPDSGHWLTSDKDQSTVRLIVPLEVGALLTANTARLADQVLRVTIATGG